VNSFYYTSCAILRYDTSTFNKVKKNAIKPNFVRNEISHECAKVKRRFWQLNHTSIQQLVKDKVDDILGSVIQDDMLTGSIVLWNTNGKVSERSSRFKPPRTATMHATI